MILQKFANTTIVLVRISFCLEKASNNKKKTRKTPNSQEYELLKLLSKLRRREDEKT